MKKTILISLLCVLLVQLLNAQVNRQLNEIVVEAEAETDAIQQQKEAIPAKIVISAKDLNTIFAGIASFCC